MNRIPVTSSNLASVGYNTDAKILQVEFKSGKKYIYYNVPEWIYQELIDPDSLLYKGSKGTFFSEVVKGKYKYEILEEVKDGT